MTNTPGTGIEVAKKRSLHLVFIGGRLLPNPATMRGQLRYSLAPS